MQPVSALWSSDISPGAMQSLPYSSNERRVAMNKAFSVGKRQERALRPRPPLARNKVISSRLKAPLDLGWTGNRVSLVNGMVGV